MAKGVSAEAREDILVQAFLTCPNISEISKKTKIPRPTIYTVIHSDSFQRKYSEARNEAVTGAIAYLQGKLGECAAVLVNTAIDTEVPAQIRVNAEGHYQKPEQITTTLHDALMIAQYYYECGLYVQFTMSLCIEWLFLFVRDDPRYSPPQQKSWYTKCTEEYPEITAMLESEQRSEIIGTLRRMPQNFLFKGLPDDIKDDYKLMDF